MYYLVANPQIRNVEFKYSDLARADIDIEAGPFETESSAKSYNEREHMGGALVIPVADDYIEEFPGDVHEDTMTLPDDELAVEVTFYPQEWQGEYVQSAASQNPVQFLVPEEDALDEDGDPLPDDSQQSDVLKDHENAPAVVRNWEGPFYITTTFGIPPEDRDDYPREI